MRAIDFEERNIIMGEGQDVFLPLPGYHNEVEQSVAFCFELNKEEIDEIIQTGKIWFKQITFNKPMNPIFASTEKSEVIKK